MDERKAKFAVATPNITLVEAVNGSDVFIGLSKGGVLNGDMVKTMAKNPIVFAMANPDPEITMGRCYQCKGKILSWQPEEAIILTSKYVLGFPYIFRGPLM
jgi:malate dehydrogenase (oxaloacetate-decarboxylating)(NADP+)